MFCKGRIVGLLQKIGTSDLGPDCDHRLPDLFLSRLTNGIQTVAWYLELWLNLYELKDSQQMKPSTFMGMLPSPLYRKGCEPTTQS